MSQNPWGYYTLSAFNSGCNPANYSLNTAVVPKITTGIYGYFYMQVHDFVGNFPQRYWAIWLDNNSNGVFELSERLTAFNANYQPNQYLYLPPTFLPGIKRMRVRLIDNIANINDFSPCDAYNAGETEDYLINVQTNEPFIYANIDKEQVGQCEVLKVIMAATGSYNSGNLFNVELSDAAGNFTNPTVILSNISNTLAVNVRLPKTIPSGNNYKVRTVSTDPVAYSFTSAAFIIAPFTQNITTNFTANTNIIKQIGKIEATNSTTNAAKTQYKAWNSVLLLPNFIANPSAGGNFKAEIVGCEE